jgi:hypothetical protein
VFTQDNDCGTFVTEHAASALNQSVITIADIELRLRMLFRVRMRLTHFDPPGPLQTIPISVICSEDAQALARRSVADAVALLKNDNKTLPLRCLCLSVCLCLYLCLSLSLSLSLSHKTLPLRAAAVSSLAVIGPTAMLSAQTNYYAGPRSPCGMRFSTLVDAMKQHVSRVLVANGTSVCDGTLSAQYQYTQSEH